MITLLELAQGEKAVVKGFKGGYKLRVQLNNLGIHEGDTIEIKKKGAFGPLLISVHNSNVALGRGVASKILVEKLNESEEE